MENTKPVILAIDDQPTILHVLIAELKDKYEVRAFSSGKDALKYLSKLRADLVLLDLDMPDMNGHEILKRLRASRATADIPVIFLTGAEDKNTEADVLDEGASDFIYKPINTRVLLTRVRLQLELSHYRQHLEALVEEKTEHLRRANEKLKIRDSVTLNLLAEITDLRDRGTGGHIIRTTEMVKVLVNHLLANPTPGYTLSQNEAEDIIDSAKLHDLGKIAVPDNILLKPESLDNDEYAVIKQHPEHGAGLLDKYIAKIGSDPFLKTARDIALYHHERWDGSGYPEGLKGEQIPLSARITALADVYDALTSFRPYKEPLNHDESIMIIKKSAGSHFDPYLTKIFVVHEKQFRDIFSSLAE